MDNDIDEVVFGPTLLQANLFYADAIHMSHLCRLSAGQIRKLSDINIGCSITVVRQDSNRYSQGAMLILMNNPHKFYT